MRDRKSENVCDMRDRKSENRKSENVCDMNIYKSLYTFLATLNIIKT